MGSEGPPVVTVHVTGFKKFYGVADNPTETIVNNLGEFMEKKGLPKGLLLGNCSVLDTAGEGSVEQLYKILETALSGQDNQFPSSGKVIWLHFGVNSGALKFAVENQAVNEATFRCPDELGWKPHKVPIIPSDGGITQIREEIKLINHKCLNQIAWKFKGIITYEVLASLDSPHMFLVRWKNHPPSKDIWITREDLEKLALDLVDDYINFKSLE